MTKLISKVQYKNFEAGEFVNVQERTYEEIIELIENFPWTNERDCIKIALTNPSITIEGMNNDFLKFALFFNQKYVLHYWDQKQTLYSRSFISLKDGYKYIKDYFGQPTFDTTDFKQEPTWFQNNLKHFVTQDFRYVVTSKSIRNYLISTSGVNFCLSILSLILILWKGFNNINVVGIIAILFAMFFVGGGLHLILFFNYYNYSKNKILIMSKGNGSFYFGNIENPLKYDKKDILQYTTTRSKGSRNQFSGFAIVEIVFKNGTVLKIPNLLIDYSAIQQKLFEYQRRDVNQFPYLRL